LAPTGRRSDRLILHPFMKEVVVSKLDRPPAFSWLVT